MQQWITENQLNNNDLLGTKRKVINQEDPNNTYTDVQEQSALMTGQTLLENEFDTIDNTI